MCSRCSTVNPPTNAFCSECGTRLGAAPAAQPAAAPPPQQAVPPAPQVPVVGAPVVGIAPGGEPPPERVVCARCRGSNAPEMSFCQFCGARLSTGQEPARPAAPEAHPEPHQPPPAAVPAPAPSPAAPPAGVDTGRYAPPATTAAAARLVVIGQDGTPGRDYPVGEQTDIGREEGAILLPNDPYVSPRHARLIQREGRFFVRDLGSVNGVFVRLGEPRRMHHADLLLVGLEVLRFEVVSDAEKGLGPAAERGAQIFGSPAAPRYARLCQRTVEGVTRDVYYLSRDETVIGREAGDIVFTNDPFMSRRHASLTRDPLHNSFVLRDLGSSNGTYVAIRGEIALANGDYLRVGQHLFRLETGASERA